MVPYDLAAAAGISPKTKSAHPVILQRVGIVSLLKTERVVTHSAETRALDPCSLTGGAFGLTEPHVFAISSSW